MSETPKFLDLSKLPTEVRAAFEAERTARLAAEQVAENLQALTVSLGHSKSVLEDANRRLEALLKELRHTVYGKRSEKLSEDERQLAFEDMEIAVSEVEETVAETAPVVPKAKRKKAIRNLGNLPDDLPRIEEVIDPESTQCPCGCGEMKPIGEDATERLDIIPAQFRVIRTIRPKYACPKCQDGVFQAKAPAHLIEGALPSEGLIAHVLVSKYADHCPLYRQSQIFARSGIDLHRSTLAGWVGKASFHLGPVVDRLAEKLKQSTKLFMDETRAPVLDPPFIVCKQTTTGQWDEARPKQGISGP